MAHATRLLQHHRSIHIFSSTFPHVSSRFLNDFSQASTGLFFPTGRNMPTKRTAKSGTLCNEGERKIAKKRGKWTKIKIRDRAT